LLNLIKVKNPNQQMMLIGVFDIFLIKCLVFETPGINKASTVA